MVVIKEMYLKQNHLIEQEPENCWLPRKTIDAETKIVMLPEIRASARPYVGWLTATALGRSPYRLPHGERK